MENWIHVDSQSGTGDKVIQVTVDENQTLSQRSTSLTFETSEGTTAAATIVQNAGVKTYAAPIVTVTYPDVPASGGSSTPAVHVTQTWGWNGKKIGGGTLEWNGLDELPEDSTTVFSSTTVQGSLNSTTGNITSVPSLGTTVKERASIGNIRYVFTINGVSSGMLSGHTVVYQEANSLESYSYSAIVENNDEDRPSPQVVNFSQSGQGDYEASVSLTTWGGFAGTVSGHQHSSIRGTNLLLSFRRRDTFTSGESETVETLSTDIYGSREDYSVVDDSGNSYELNLVINSGFTLEYKMFAVTTGGPDGSDRLSVSFKQGPPPYVLVAHRLNNIEAASTVGFATGGKFTWSLDDGDLQSYFMWVVIKKDLSSSFTGTDYYLVKGSSSVQVTESLSWVNTLHVYEDRFNISIRNNTASQERNGQITFSYPDVLNGVYGGPFTLSITQPGTTYVTVQSQGSPTMTIEDGGVSFSDSHPKLTLRFSDGGGTNYDLEYNWTVLGSGSSYQGAGGNMSVPEGTTLTLSSIILDFTDFTAGESSVTLDPQATVAISSSNPSGLNTNWDVSLGTDTFSAGSSKTFPITGSNRTFTVGSSSVISVTGSIGVDASVS